jgi:hypothetical protein
VNIDERRLFRVVEATPLLSLELLHLVIWTDPIKTDFELTEGKLGQSLLHWHLRDGAIVANWIVAGQRRNGGICTLLRSSTPCRRRKYVLPLWTFSTASVE